MSTLAADRDLDPLRRMDGAILKSMGKQHATIFILILFSKRKASLKATRKEMRCQGLLRRGTSAEGWWQRCQISSAHTKKASLLGELHLVGEGLRLEKRCWKIRLRCGCMGKAQHPDSIAGGGSATLQGVVLRAATTN